MPCGAGTYSTGGQSACTLCMKAYYSTSLGATSSAACLLDATSSVVTAMSGSSAGQITIQSTTSIVQICQFIAQYQRSDLTDDIQNRMKRALLNLLNSAVHARMTRVVATVTGYKVRASIEMNDVILDFPEPEAIAKRESVLISVSLTNFQGSIASITSTITQEKINSEMAAVNLKLVQLVAITSTSSTLGGKVQHTMAECFPIGRNTSA